MDRNHAISPSMLLGENPQRPFGKHRDVGFAISSITHDWANDQPQTDLNLFIVSTVMALYQL